VDTLFLDLAILCQNLENTRKKNEKISYISSFLSKLKEKETAVAVYLIVGSIFSESDKRVLDVSGKTIAKILDGSKQTSLARSPLTILEVHKYFSDIAEVSGSGSRKKKENILSTLLGQAGVLERKYLLRILFKDMRIGVVEGVMLDAIAKASSSDSEIVRKSHMFLGDLGEVARVALMHGKKGLNQISMKMFRPVKPMLAEMSYDIKEVLRYHGGKTSLEYKLDGARIQIHKKGSKVMVYSRRLSDVTESLPDIVGLIKKHVQAQDAIIDGEVVAIGGAERPLPFQDLMRRFRRVKKVGEMVKSLPLKLYIFDILYLNGRNLMDLVYVERRDVLLKTCKDLVVKQKIVINQLEADKFLEKAIKSGHEGFVAKKLDSRYSPGVRGKGWFKIKQVENLDLVIVAADWGYGRRTGWLSNYHLAVRSEDPGEFLVIGKTFKGLTDDEFRVLTKRLLEIKNSENLHTVYVKPKIVVEVTFNEIQRSSKYKSGLALRFARINRIRDDKGSSEIDTIQRIKELYERKFRYKARYL
jgi:DNA ligase-1